MATRQPSWLLLANLGDASPLEHGGYFIYADETGVYAPEGEILETPEEEPEESVAETLAGYIVHRFTLDRLQLIEDKETHKAYLVSERYAPEWPHALSQYDEWFHRDLQSVAEFVGSTLEELRAQFCSELPHERAHAYRAVGDYHGLDNLDAYPLRLTRKETEARYTKGEL
jgi:hypothetical protein